MELARKGRERETEEWRDRVELARRGREKEREERSDRVEQVVGEGGKSSSK